MSKDLSANDYQDNKERIKDYQKGLMKNIRMFLKKKTKKATYECE